ncbi:TSUP family transporter [Micromonospora sp. NPDC050417]|uniref:TSUP family transporter n=1 Tax=Micromonospora sp. NPDC050417 TaxID=3364280 RepID=UPI0037A051A5
MIVGETQGWQLGLAVLLGALAAALGTPTGVSGGLLLLPLLMTVFGLGGTVASATNLLFNIVSTPMGIARQARIDTELTLLLVGSAAPAAVLGVLVNVFLLGDSAVFRVLVAAMLAAVAASILLPRPSVPAARPSAAWTPLTRPNRRLMVVVGIASGLLGGFYGLGGAVLAAPVALLVTGWPVVRISGAALVTTLVVSLTGLAAYSALSFAGHTTVRTPHWPLGLALGVGGVIGGYAAARYAARIPDRSLRTVLAVLIGLGALRLALL